MLNSTPQLLQFNANNYPNEPAISVRDAQGEWQSNTWSEFFDFCMQISKSLLALGYEKSDKLSIYSYNRKEWFGCYAASQMIGGVSVGVYHTCSPDEVEWVVGNSDSKVVFVGNNPMDNDEHDKMPNHRFVKIVDKLPKVEKIVMMDGIDTLNHEKAITWEEFIELGKNENESEVLSRMDQVEENDTSSLIYTSGTTGNPKGVELTAGNWTFELNCVDKTFEFNQGERYISWLPLAHVFGQLVDNHYWIRRALHLHVCDNPLYVVDYAKEIKPHLFIGVPRIYEKIYSNVKAAIESKAILKIGLKIPGLSNVFKGKLKQATGFVDTRFAISGAAPINPDILTLFQSLDIPLFEGYGMTENSAGATLNYVGHNKIGSVGMAMQGSEIKIGDGGEILIRGGHVMKGYYKNEEVTAETIKDGWLHTGDVGEIDNDGYLTITGRIKEIYVLSGGKNIAPLVVEETMKSIPIISQCFLVGDRRKYCSAIFTLDVGVILRDKLDVESANVPKDPMQQLSMLNDFGKSLSDYTESPELYSEIEVAVNQLNMQFSNPEQVKKFVILPRDFTVDDGELTPTLKIRRKQISENWASEIESMYVDA